MKNLNLLWMAGVCLFSAFTFSACSDDDDEDGAQGGGSGISAAYFEADGKRTDYRYAYYWDDGEYGVEMDIATLDLRYYYSNPDKVTPGLIVSVAWLWFDGPTVSGNYYTYTDSDDKTFEFETDTWDLYKDVTEAEDDNSVAATYNTEYSSSRVSTMKVTRSGNAWTMDAPSLLLKCDDAWDEYNRPTHTFQTTGKFYFQGSAVLMEGYYDEGVDYDTRAVKVEDPGFREWLKQLRKNHSK